MKRALVIALIAFFIFVACLIDNNGGAGKPRYMNIVGAKALMVAPKGSVVRMIGARVAERASKELVFLKQLEDGTWVQVRTTDEKGAEVRMIPPTEIWSVRGGGWIVMGFGNEVYMVSTSTGDVYDITSVGKPNYRMYNSSNSRWSRNAIYSDKNNIVYYNILDMGWSIKLPPAQQTQQQSE